MSSWESELRTRYSQVEVPATLRTQDAIDGRVAEVQEAFFADIVDALQISHLAQRAILNINVRMLVPPDTNSLNAHHLHSLEDHEPQGMSLGVSRFRASDDFLTQLDMNGIQPLATVLRTRDDWNYQIAQFTKYDLEQKTVDVLGEIDGLEGIIGQSF